MAGSLYERDTAVIADIEKVRFFPLAVTGGRGSYLIDESGRELLDLSATWGAASLGYGHPAVVEAATRAVANPAGASILSSVNEPAVALAEELLEITPSPPDGGKRRVWLGHSGSDANDAVVRAIPMATGRPRILSFIGAYHGGISGSAAISGHSSHSHSPGKAGLVQIPYPDSYRPQMAGDIGESVLGYLDYLFDTVCPPESVGAVFIEPIQSDGGLIVPPPGFLKSLQERCRKTQHPGGLRRGEGGPRPARHDALFPGRGPDPRHRGLRQRPRRRPAPVGGDRPGRGDERDHRLRHRDHRGQRRLGRGRARRPAHYPRGEPAGSNGRARRAADARVCANSPTSTR